MSENHPAPVTVIGLGLMGAALAEAFLRNGHPTTVWNRSAAKAAPLVAKGAANAATVTEAVTANALVVVCLSLYDNVDEVLDTAGDALDGRTIVNLTNGTPRQARAMAERATARGARYLDGGIMAVPPMIGQPAASILYSGPEDVYEPHRATLAALGTPRLLGADPGLAALYEMALLSAMYGMFGGFYQALALVRTEDVPAAEFTPMVVTWLTAMMHSLPRQALAIDTGEYATEVSSLATNQAAFPNLVDASRDQGVGVRLMEPIHALIERAVAEGHGEDGLARLVEFAERP
ncbi:MULTISPECIES: NAD(P)-dependent oxidoreductase [Thermomonosporaceae]|uniref:NAD(P)-dependent oxidoreductase n=1 Tax=Thermomonosporaceae TaxID=2012 RepID=UPI00255B22A8|nr:MULTISPECIES: NAD(P)-binding domain-containing protein [Thermomonosporaceae]MDL4777562.1 NAD(P)-binding domain-containing protein [Actinomadura xylanilytica]